MQRLSRQAVTELDSGQSRAPAPVTANEALLIDGVGKVTLGVVTQRNWSRVGIATKPDGQRFFCKQFVDRLGTAHPRGFDGELRTRDVIGEPSVAGLSVVPVAGLDRSRLIMLFPYFDMETIDSMSFSSFRHRAAAERVGVALAEILEERRVPGDPDSVCVWKGLDPKNVGWDEDGRFWLFDFGPPTEVPIQTAAGQVVAAGLLSRWVARPGTHMVWPERWILRRVCTPVAALTTYEEVDRFLVQHHDLRVREPQRSGYAATATRLGLQTVGRAYWYTARQEARRLYR